MGANGRQYVKENYAWEKVLDRLEEAILSLGTNSRRRREYQSDKSDQSDRSDSFSPEEIK